MGVVGRGRSRHMGPIIIIVSTISPSGYFSSVKSSIEFFPVSAPQPLHQILSPNVKFPVFLPAVLKMEAVLCFLPGGGDGGGASSGVSTNKSVVCEEETAERLDQGASEESAFSGEAELELGLGLSIGGGCGRVKPGGGAERGRILTAKDFPSAVFNRGFSSSSSSSSSPAPIRVSSSPSPAVAVSGTKRAAEAVSQEGGSPTGSSQVVGWPPIRAHRMNSLLNQPKSSNGKSEEDSKKKKTNAEGTAKPGFVKVSMDGVVIGRKLDLHSHSSYQSLAQAVHHMFFSPASSVAHSGGGGDQEANKISKLLDGSAEYVLTYEDKDGDWMLAGDIPWRMFVGSVKKLRIMRTSDANGLCMHGKESQTFS